VCFERDESELKKKKLRLFHEQTANCHVAVSTLASKVKLSAACRR
jgi:hypothetical protein